MRLSQQQQQLWVVCDSILRFRLTVQGGEELEADEEGRFWRDDGLAQSRIAVIASCAWRRESQNWHCHFLASIYSISSSPLCVASVDRESSSSRRFVLTLVGMTAAAFARLTILLLLGIVGVVALTYVGHCGLTRVSASAG